MRVQSFLEARYTGERPGADRFKKTRGEYHASHMGKCQRETYLKFREGTPDEASPYFELGNRMEDLYGAILVWAYDDKINEGHVKTLDNAELVEESDVVHQDVTCDIHVEDDIVITGESDWVIMSEPCEPLHVTVSQDDVRHVQFADGSTEEYEPGEETPFELVIETKTSNIQYRRKYGYKFEHEYQVRTYMIAFDCSGEVVYLSRDNLDELLFDFDRDRSREADLELRAYQLHHFLGEEELPEADPPREGVCKWCHFQDECKESGGQRWDDPDWEPIERKERG